jgi:hypothetical protein
VSFENNQQRWYRLSALLLLMITGCSEQKVEIYDIAPGVEIIAPDEGDVFAYDEPISFEGMVTDSEDSLDALAVAWMDFDEIINEGLADSAGLITFHSPPLDEGAHVIILSAVDSEGQLAETEIEIVVQAGPGVEEETGPVGTKPTVTLDAPIDLDEFIFGMPVNVVGVVFDLEDTADSLALTVTSSRDGVLWTGESDSDGRVSVTLEELSEGLHELKLSAIDSDGRRGRDEANIVVEVDASPIVTITSPNDGDYFWITDTIVLTGEAVDDLTGGEDLRLTWISSVDGSLHSGPGTYAGTSSVSTTLSAGNHDILLKVLDVDGNSGVDMIAIEVRDPLDHDGDMDGYTENDGDCDDTDPYIHPGAVEVCDDVDNDCDGQINENDWDAQEPSDSLGEAIDAGTIDGSIIIDSDEWDMSGLTFHSPVDEDWIKFDADDDIYDNVSVHITVGLMPTGGNYLVELFLTSDSTTVPVDSDSGSGNLIVNYTGSLTSGGEDDFALRISSMSWPGGSCGDAYSVTIVN